MKKRLLALAMVAAMIIATAAHLAATAALTEARRSSGMLSTLSQQPSILQRATASETTRSSMQSQRDLPVTQAEKLLLVSQSPGTSLKTELFIHSISVMPTGAMDSRSQLRTSSTAGRDW